MKEDMRNFWLMLPHLTFFLDVLKRCEFMKEELKDHSLGLRNDGTETLEVLYMLRRFGLPKVRFCHILEVVP